MPDQTKNVFVSHVHEDDAGLQKLKDLLGKNGMSLRDASINSSSPNEAKSEDYIKSQILAPQINWAGTFICYVTPETRNSKWVNWEIEYAEKQGKRIVGIWGHGDNNCEVPDALAKYADAMVGWNADRIMGAIDGTINGWDNPDGSECATRPIRRFTC